NLTMRRMYLPGLDTEYARILPNGTAAWYLTDRLGSVRDIVNYTGSTLDHIDYSGYGIVTNETSSSNGDRYKFASYEYDSEMLLYYDRARPYDPATGKFYGQDSIPTPNLDEYEYVRNDPTGATDPSGEILLEDSNLYGTGTSDYLTRNNIAFTPIQIG